MGLMRFAVVAFVIAGLPDAFSHHRKATVAAGPVHQLNISTNPLSWLRHITKGGDPVSHCHSLRLAATWILNSDGICAA
jgi:hypothetical protein